jgi:hypothetical protein
MELLTSLVSYIQHNELTKQLIIKLGIDLCKALEVCQKYNIIHRDIKPENIFVSELGDFKLGDFGIARQVEKTMSGLSRKGTFSYIAPEVYKGEAYGSTVDIYSLGMVMYRLLNNNRLPFMPPYPERITYAAKEMSLVRRMNGEVIPMPSNDNGRLAEIVLKACAYEPRDRYDSPSVMRKALEDILYNDAESKVIYPNGDVVDMNSVHYVSGSVKPEPKSEEAETVAMPKAETEIEAEETRTIAMPVFEEEAEIDETLAMPQVEQKELTEEEKALCEKIISIPWASKTEVKDIRFKVPEVEDKMDTANQAEIENNQNDEKQTKEDRKDNADVIDINKSDIDDGAFSLPKDNDKNIGFEEEDDNCVDIAAILWFIGFAIVGLLLCFYGNR